jgi:hypothetical protein
MSWGFFAMSYGDAWRVRRRAFHAVNLADQVIDYQPGQLAGAHLFLQNLIDDPKGFVAACKGCATFVEATVGLLIGMAAGSSAPTLYGRPTGSR